MVSFKDIQKQAKEKHDEEVKAKQFMPDHETAKLEAVLDKECIIDGAKIAKSKNTQYENPKMVIVAVTVEGAKKLVFVHNAVIVETFESAMANGVEIVGLKVRFTKVKADGGFNTNVMEILD